MKTKLKMIIFESSNWVYILPLRNENFFKCSLRKEIILVYILPLRNENEASLMPYAFWTPCLYPTFKEWKLVPPRGNQGGLQVYILPLRNENT